MTHVHENDDHARRPSLGRTFSIALRSVAIAWIVAFFLVTAAVAILAPEMLLTCCLIAVASGAIAMLSMLPGLFLGNGEQANDATAFPRVAMFGMLHRLAGTVALFLLCRYQLAASVEIIASFTIGWYLYLTIVEVVALARELPKIDRWTDPDCSISMSVDT